MFGGSSLPRIGDASGGDILGKQNVRPAVLVQVWVCIIYVVAFGRLGCSGAFSGQGDLFLTFAKPGFVGVRGFCVALVTRHAGFIFGPGFVGGQDWAAAAVA